MVGGRRDRGQFGKRNLSEATMWVEVGETEDSMVDAMYQEPVSGFR